MAAELQLLWGALVMYTLAGSTAIGATVLARRAEYVVLALVVTGLVVHAASMVCAGSASATGRSSRCLKFCRVMCGACC